MKLSKTLLAVAAMACGSAMATTPVGQILISSGASAPKGNFKAALQARCAGAFAEYTDGGTNRSTYVCAAAGTVFSATPTAAEYAAATPLNFTGTNFAEVRLNVTGGSFTAACLMAFGTASWASASACNDVNGAGLGAADTYVSPALATVPASSAANTLAPAGSVVGGGFMDVEPAVFADVVTVGVVPGGTNVSSGFGQVFGVAASAALWNAMYEDQRNAGILPAALCPAVPAAGMPAACWPVIGKPEMATIMSGNQTSALYNGAAAPLTTNGVGFLMKTAAAKAAFGGTGLTYARRADTSGTQASAQAYFLGTKTGLFPVGVVGCGASSGIITVACASSTGNVRTILNTAGTYALGVMSSENNQAGQNWRWLRVGGMHVGEDAFPGGAGLTNSVTAIAGLYDFWFTLRIQRPTAAPVTAFWNSVITGLGSAPSTVGLFKAGIGSESTFVRNPNRTFVPVSQ